MPKISTIAIYASVFALIVAVIAIGYRPPEEVSGVASATPVTTTDQTDTTSVDQVVETSVAANLAQATNLSVAPNTAEVAASAQIDSELAQPDSSVITKPQIVQPTASNFAITNYTVKAGDTVTSVAAANNLSTNTVKWANDLTSDALIPGTVLVILPTDGVLYTVKSGDTLQSISTKYDSDQTQIILYNDLVGESVTVGQKLILPGGTLPTNEQPGYVAPITTEVTAFAGYSSGFGGQTWRISYGTTVAGDPYAFGNCTYYAYARRLQLGLPVGSNWGNASTWAAYARADGYTVNSTPSVGAIMQNGGGAGHVAIVEDILPDGDLSISEMNAYVPGGGYDIVSGRIVPAAYVSQYLYIH